MKWIATVLPFVLIPLIVRGVLALAMRPKAGKKGLVHLPVWFVVFGLIVMLGAAGIALYLAFVKKQIAGPILLTLFGLLPFSLVIGYINCRTTYDKDGFVSSNFFGKKTEYRWADVTAIRRGQGDSHLYMGDRRVMVDGMAVGGLEFLAYANARYAELHGGAFIPDYARVKGKRKLDPFNGHILNPGQFVALYIIFLVLFLAFCAFIIVSTLSPVDPEDTQTVTTVFTSCKRNGNTLILHDGAGRAYHVARGEGVDEAFSALVSEHASVTLHVRTSSSRGQEYDNVYAAERDGVSVMTFEERHDNNVKNGMPVLIGVPAAMILLWGLIVGLSICFGRDPKKHPRAVKLFFKEEYIVY